MVSSIYRAEYARLREAMRAMRVTANLTQTELAITLGVGQSYVSKIERGENFVDVVLFSRWCTACGVSPGMTLDGLHL